MPKVFATSLDYDGAGCAIYPELMVGLTDLSKPYKPYTHPLDSGIYQTYRVEGEKSYRGQHAEISNYPRWQFMPRIFEQIQHQFHRYFNAGRATASNVDLYVGSNRQSIELDESNAMNNHNGSCFNVYQRFAREQQINFNPLLLADAEVDTFAHANKLYQQGKLTVEGTSVRVSYVSDLLKPIDKREPGAMVNPNKKCRFDKLKARTLLIQLQDLKRRYPNDEIEFVFIDDDHRNELMSHLMQSFKVFYDDEQFRQTLPSKITIKCIKFQWFPALENAQAMADKTLSDITKHIRKGAAYPDGLDERTVAWLEKELKAAPKLKKVLRENPHVYGWDLTNIAYRDTLIKEGIIHIVELVQKVAVHLALPNGKLQQLVAAEFKEPQVFRYQSPSTTAEQVEKPVAGSNTTEGRRKLTFWQEGGATKRDIKPMLVETERCCLNEGVDGEGDVVMSPIRA